VFELSRSGGSAARCITECYSFAPSETSYDAREKVEARMENVDQLYEQTQKWGEAVKTFLLAVSESKEAEAEPFIAHQSKLSREHYDWLGTDIESIWNRYRAAKTGS
jgi:hypothetical protein